MYISVISPSLHSFSRGYDWRTDEVIEIARGEDEREKNNSPLVGLEHTMFLISKSSCLRLVKGLKEQKLKLGYLYFILKSLHVCLWEHFSYCPHSLEEHRTITGAGGSRCELAYFSFSALGRLMILVNEHFLQESCGVKSGACLGEPSQTLDDPTEAGIPSHVGIQGGLCAPGILCSGKMLGEKAVFGIRRQTLALRCSQQLQSSEWLMGQSAQCVCTYRRDCLFVRDVKTMSCPGLGLQSAQKLYFSCEISFMINLVVPSLSLPISAPPPPLPMPLPVPPFSLPFPHVSLLVHSQSRLCSPLHSLFSSLQAPVPKSFCQSLRPSSTTWYKLHSPFLSCPCVACVWACLGQSVTTVQNSCAV